MLTYGLSPFFAGAKLLIICEIHKYFVVFLIIYIKKSIFYLTIGAQASISHSVISLSR